VLFLINHFFSSNEFADYALFCALSSTLGVVLSLKVEQLVQAEKNKLRLSYLFPITLLVIVPVSIICASILKIFSHAGLFVIYFGVAITIQSVLVCSANRIGKLYFPIIIKSFCHLTIIMLIFIKVEWLTTLQFIPSFAILNLIISSSGLIIFLFLYKRMILPRRRVRWSYVNLLIKKYYRRLPLLNSVGIVNNVSINSPVFILSSLGEQEVVSIYYLIQRILSPISLIISKWSRSLYVRNDFNDGINKLRLDKLSNIITSIIILLSLVSFIIYNYLENLNELNLLLVIGVLMGTLGQMAYSPFSFLYTKHNQEFRALTLSFQLLALRCLSVTCFVLVGSLAFILYGLLSYIGYYRYFLTVRRLI